jgi:alcohol dehydrogenase
VGRDVWHIGPGRRVVLSPHFVARDNVHDPAQILIGLTAGPEAANVLEDWPDGTLAEYAFAPVDAVTPLDGLENLDAAQLAAVGRFIVPFGGLLRGRLAAGETLVVNGATGAFGRGATGTRSRRSRKRRAGALRRSRSRATWPPTQRRSARLAAAALTSPSTWSAMRAIRARRSQR